MTAPDPRLDVIGDRLEAAKYHGAPAFMIPTQEVAYLLAELRKAHEALERVEGLAGAWTARGEHDMAFSKTVPDEDIAMVLLTEGASMVENARHIRVAVAAAKGDEQ